MPCVALSLNRTRGEGFPQYGSSLCRGRLSGVWRLVHREAWTDGLKARAAVREGGGLSEDDASKGGSAQPGGDILKMRRRRMGAEA